ncbi:MAG: PpiC-type peptidyl-prolyl cis-trans isomerase [Rickettsiaceae bacterium]|nr:PpiC-type peptidyl-prolyl cis-trans isomerase [Rickettsiaceae bacterium]
MKNSKNPSQNLIIVVAGVVVLVGAVFGFKHFSKKEGSGDIVAHVNGKPVYMSEANEQVSKVTKEGVNFDALDEQSKLVIIKGVAAHRIILAEANKSGVANKKEVKDKVAEFRDKVVEEEYLAETARKSVAEEKIKERYDSLVKDLKGKTQYKVRHIVLKSQDAAAEVAKKVKDESFEKVAKRESIDGQTAAKGGDLGYLLGGTMIKEFENVIPKMSLGEVSDPIKTKFGWHVVKLEDKRAAESLPFEQVRDSVARDLYNESIQEYVKNVLDKADIKIAEKEAAADSDKKADNAGGIPNANAADSAEVTKEPKEEAVKAAPAAAPAAAEKKAEAVKLVKDTKKETKKSAAKEKEKAKKE